MKKSEKEAIVWLIGVIGVLFLLAGIFLSEISFTDGLIIAIVFWIIAGFMKRVWKTEKGHIKKKPRRKKR